MVHAEQQVVILFELDRERNAHGPGIKQTQLGNDPAVAPLAQDGDPVARPDAQPGEAGTRLESLLTGFGIRGGLEMPVPFFEQERAVGMFCHRLLKQVDDGLFHSGQSIFSTARNADWGTSTLPI